MYSVPLRRALVTGTDLPYPEGVAAAEVLKVGAGVGGAEENRRGLRSIIWSSIVSAAYAILAQTKIVAADAARSFSFGSGRDHRFDQPFDGADRRRPSRRHGRRHRDARRPAHQLVHPRALADRSAGLALRRRDIETWSEPRSARKVRFIGAGTIGVAAIWTLLRIMGPITRGITSAIAANRARRAGGQDSLALTERDIPIGIVAGAILLAMIPIGLLLSAFAQSGPIAARAGRDAHA